jgi:hypothetical protein
MMMRPSLVDYARSAPSEVAAWREDGNAAAKPVLT